MPTISIWANIVRPSVDHRSDDTAFGAETFSWQDSVHSWKAGPGEVMTVENLFYSKRYFEHEKTTFFPNGKIFSISSFTII